MEHFVFRANLSWQESSCGQIATRPHCILLGDQKVSKPFYLVALLIAGMIYFSSVTASQEGQDNQQSVAPTGDEIVAMCEDKYSAENYADEEERHGLIDKCINDNVNDPDPAVVDG